jgi:hypothetical protein
MAAATSFNYPQMDFSFQMVLGANLSSSMSNREALRWFDVIWAYHDAMHRSLERDSLE